MRFAMIGNAKVYDTTISLWDQIPLFSFLGNREMSFRAKENPMRISLALSTLAGSARRTNTVPITCSTTQGGKGSREHNTIIW